jgi:hypothetical protein
MCVVIRWMVIAIHSQLVLTDKQRGYATQPIAPTLSLRHNIEP